MLFLLNDVVFDLDEACPVTPADARRFEKLDLDYVIELGCELFAENPLLHRTIQGAPAVWPGCCTIASRS
jgi:hypothetical protein